MAWLIVISKDIPPSICELGEGWATIGRAEGNTFQIVESSISARHCEVCVHGDQLLVRDLLSTNGTFVSGKRISGAVVQAGGTLRLGDVEFRFDTAGFKAAPASLLLAKSPATESSPARPPAGQKPARLADEKSGEPFRVLFVDDSLAFLELFGELCAEFSGHTWKIYKASSADAALALLNEVTVDLVLLDIGMPMMDGLQLLSIVNRRFPGLKIVVVTGNATEGRRAQALSQGAELFLQKPVTADGLTYIFKMLEELLLWRREGFTGALRQVNLQEIIQLQCSGRHSAILEVHNPDLQGLIFIEAGRVVHASVQDLSGERAFFKLLSMPDGEFQVRPFRAPPQRTIDARWEFLLLDIARGVDGWSTTDEGQPRSAGEPRR